MKQHDLWYQLNSIRVKRGRNMSFTHFIMCISQVSSSKKCLVMHKVETRTAYDWKYWIVLLEMNQRYFINSIYSILQMNAPKISKNSVRFNHLLMTLACVDICFILVYTTDILMQVFVKEKLEYLWYGYLYSYILWPGKGLMMSSSIYMVVAISAER